MLKHRFPAIAVLGRGTGNLAGSEAELQGREGSGSVCYKAVTTITTAS